MNSQNIECITLSKIGNIRGLLNVLDKYKELSSNDTLYLNIDCNGMIFPEYLCILVSWIKFLEYKGIKVVKKILNENDYVSRINFYNEIGYDYIENFNRHNGSGKFIEITRIDNTNTNYIVNNIMNVIKCNIELHDTVFDCLNYCLFEVVDNINEHSESPIGGYIVVQNYPQKNILKIAIIDSGLGIYNTLKNSGKEEYKNINESDALKCSIKEKNSRFQKRGYGLYHTSNFMKHNKGIMSMHSGNSTLSINNGKIKTYSSGFWQGLIVYFNINTNKSVDINDIFDGKENIPISVNESDDILNGYL